MLQITFNSVKEDGHVFFLGLSVLSLFSFFTNQEAVVSQGNRVF